MTFISFTDFLKARSEVESGSDFDEVGLVFLVVLPAFSHGRDEVVHILGLHVFPVLASVVPVILGGIPAAVSGAEQPAVAAAVACRATPVTSAILLARVPAVCTLISPGWNCRDTSWRARGRERRGTAVTNP